ncbi:DUF3221 domain-containing protein [Halalkalibacterium halodurans]|uniref:DUF3221 domain-containing protein n=1 Tax=Halalkalibacterium halodurans TaxID=86665 RepID=A0A0M0KI21_ALKHA|nr:DUF3221 domain-containing protein [Halalkalibacterium halodurans]MED3647967.1 DUF3221 domain-containing protein [Halalkalibacterium halodurans]MED4163763.1 DUF3221 domain-containing protein [Halalkalibacterium halodurans]TES48928.1 DUF3221 domain-containing protein [Halalkalibacterium halodurans]TPE68962.1 DUF3221 domain-containing protein [Halalkalibacterium halodurans]
MKHLFYSVTFFIVLVGISGCGTGNHEVDAEGAAEDVDVESASIIGYVVDVNEETTLVVSIEAERFDDSGGKEEFHNAIRFYHMPIEVEIGERIAVWAEGAIAYSYPAQAEVADVVVLEEKKPEGAKLSEKEVIQRVLSEQEESALLTSITFDKESSHWNVHLQNLFGQKHERIIDENKLD